MALAKAMSIREERVELIKNQSLPAILLHKQEQRQKGQIKRKMKMTSYSSNLILSSWSMMDQKALRRR